MFEFGCSAVRDHRERHYAGGAAASCGSVGVHVCTWGCCRHWRGLVDALMPALPEALAGVVRHDDPGTPGCGRGSCEGVRHGKPRPTVVWSPYTNSDMMSCAAKPSL